MYRFGSDLLKTQLTLFSKETMEPIQAGIRFQSFHTGNEEYKTPKEMKDEITALVGKIKEIGSDVNRLKQKVKDQKAEIREQGKSLTQTESNCTFGIRNTVFLDSYYP